MNKNNKKYVIYDTYSYDDCESQRYGIKKINYEIIQFRKTINNNNS